MREAAEEMTVYAKNCFDRFGDDLTELIVGYLTLEDKFIFECLSKRIQALIFNRHSHLVIDQKYKLLRRRAFGGFSYQKFIQLLTKLKNLTAITINGTVVVDTQVLRFIANLCPNVRHISLDKGCILSELMPNGLKNFSDKCGHQIKSLNVYQQSRKINLAELLRVVPNVVTLAVVDLSDLILSGVQFSRLKNITFVTKTAVNLLTLHTTDYAKNLRSVTAYMDVHGWSNRDIKQVFAGFRLLTDLRSLELKIGTIDDTTQVHNGLHVVGRDCRRLSRLAVHLYMGPTASAGEPILLKNFNQFTSLSSLVIGVYHYYKPSVKTFGSFEDLKDLTRLRHLTLDVNYLSDTCFENIGQYLPHLSSLVVISGHNLSDTTLEHLSHMRSLESLYIEKQSFSPQRVVTDYGIKQLVENCIPFRRLVLKHYIVTHYKGFDITFSTVEKFVSKARLYPNTRFHLKANASLLNITDRSELFESLNRIRPNLTFEFPNNICARSQITLSSVHNWPL